MEFKQFIDKALKIREKYRDFEIKKYGKEWNNKEIFEGFNKDVADLNNIIRSLNQTERHQEDIKRLSHELSDCLWSIIVLAHQYGIDLEKEYFKTMDDIDNKLDVKA